MVAAVADRPIRAPDPAARPPLVGPGRDADLAGRHIVVTAGGTREAIDPVRFIGNRSTGKMGVAIVRAALDRGARVTLLAANVEVPLPEDDDLTVVRVESTADLRAALLRTATPDGERAGFDALVMAAAVADFRPTGAADRKLERGGSLTLELEPTPDLLAEVARIARGLDTDGAPTRQPLRPDADPRRVRRGDRFARSSRATSCGARAWTCWSRTTSPSRAPGSGPTRTGSSSSRRTASRDELPLLPKRAVADAILDRVAIALDDRDAAAQTGASIEPAREPA